MCNVHEHSRESNGFRFDDDVRPLDALATGDLRQVSAALAAVAAALAPFTLEQQQHVVFVLLALTGVPRLVTELQLSVTSGLGSVHARTTPEAAAPPEVSPVARNRAAESHRLRQAKYRASHATLSSANEPSRVTLRDVTRDARVTLRDVTRDARASSIPTSTTTNVLTTEEYRTTEVQENTGKEALVIVEDASARESVTRDARVTLRDARVTLRDVTRDGDDALRVTLDSALPSASDSAPGGRGFDRFWAAYPKKVGKGDARRAWAKVKGDQREKQILSGLEQNLSYIMRECGKYIPNPATWLNQGRWEDESPDAPLLTPRTAGNMDAMRRFLNQTRIEGGSKNESG